MKPRVCNKRQTMVERRRNLLVQSIETRLTNDINSKVPPQVNTSRLFGVLSRIFFDDHQKFRYLNDEGQLVVWSMIQGKKLVEDIYGNLIDNIPAIKKAMGAAYTDEVAQQLLNTPWRLVWQEFAQHWQRNELIMVLDMFISESSMEIGDEQVVLQQPWPGVTYLGKWEQKVVDDYLQHFPQLPDVLDMVVGARFAGNRKQAYLWMRCESDWGKTFFKALLEKCGVVAEANINELTTAVRGGPSGLQPEELRRSIALVLDEFASVKAELKNLERTLTLAPKNQMRTKIEVFSKIFLSADTVQSLVGEHGVEDQMANRFNMILGKGTLDQRPMFQDPDSSANGIGPDAYFKNIACWVADYLDLAIQKLRAMGRDKAMEKGTAMVAEFHKKYAIDKQHKRLSAGLPALAEEFGAWLLRHAIELYTQNEFVPAPMDVSLFKERLIYEDGELYLKAPAKIFQEWRKKEISESEQVIVSHRHENIYKLISMDGEGLKSRKLRHGATAASGRKSHDCIHLRIQYGNAVFTGTTPSVGNGKATSSGLVQ